MVSFPLQSVPETRCSGNGNLSWLRLHGKRSSSCCEYFERGASVSEDAAGYVSRLARKISISLTTTQRLATCGEPIGGLPLGDRGGVIHSNRCAGTPMRSPNVALDAYVRALDSRLGLDEPIPEQLTLAVRQPVDVLLAGQCSPMIEEVTWQQQRVTTRLALVG